jgi:uncharacterized protein YceK
MRKLLILAAVGLSLGGCAQLKNALTEIQGVYTYATTTTVSSGQAAIVANAYDTLKATATNYGNYCIAQKFPLPVCSASNRRIVIKAVRTGDAARAQIELPITTGQPVTAALYNTIVAVIKQLQAAPINVAKAQ